MSDAKMLHNRVKLFGRTRTSNVFLLMFLLTLKLQMCLCSHDCDASLAGLQMGEICHQTKCWIVCFRQDAIELICKLLWSLIDIDSGD